jgi:amino-acid N-acetyltransferase
MDLHIERARQEDANELVALLAESSLPVDGFLDHLATTLVARSSAGVIGIAGLELYADGALLRSVCVAAGSKGAGVGRQLVEATMRMAADRAISSLYLLTTTADDYFSRFGFERIERRQVPLSVQSSVEFTSVCPSSATVMRRGL